MCKRSALPSIALLLVVGTAAAADGLVPPDGSALWPQWQARIAVGATASAPVSLVDPAAPGRAAPQQLGAVLGDYYFQWPGLRLPFALGGLRATGGVMAGTSGLKLKPSRPLLRDAASDAAAAYVGLGYTGQALKGSFSVTADLGVAAENSGTSQLGRALFGTQGLDDAARELRLSPVLQLGVRYAF